MIRRVYERACLAKGQHKIIVATDDPRIEGEVRGWGGEVVLTSIHHLTGTERVAEAITLLEEEYDIVVNVQGDEPFLNPHDIDQLINAFYERNQVDIATLACTIKEENDYHSPSVVKVVARQDNMALYFSRAPVPFSFKSSEKVPAFRHIGIYAFRNEVLKKVVNLKPSHLEITESLEQLRWLENGYSIFICHTDEPGPAIDTPDDVERALLYMHQHPMQ